MGCMLLIQDYVMVCVLLFFFLIPDKPEKLLSADWSIHSGRRWIRVTLMTALVFLPVSGGRLYNVCNVRNENARTYSPSMAWCCPPLAAAHPRVSPLSLSLSLFLYLSLFILLSGNAHILPVSPLISPNIPPLSRSPPLSTLMSFRCIRIGLRLQQPFSAGSILPPSLAPPLPPSVPPSLPPSSFLPLSLFLFLAANQPLIIRPF